MMIHEITEKVGKHKARKRIGRGRGSGHGKTAGRGHKGAGSRSGHSAKIGFEGGQMPWFRRLPKRGFSNAHFRTDYQIVNLVDLARCFEDGASITPQKLASAGLIRDVDQPIKVLAKGDALNKLDVTANKFSASAKKKIEDAGGSVSELPTRVPWTRSKK